MDVFIIYCHNSTAFPGFFWCNRFSTILARIHRFINDKHPPVAIPLKTSHDLKKTALPIPKTIKIIIVIGENIAPTVK